ncbi:uncharacterized protein LAJ45_03465 [Morchella importuna]|uniref:Mitochondrial F1F0-ATP synthase g subunit n=1 Tax=Morchella conica CCBAS932 TaxID=1392247 RepID=A0A3N4KRS4_9PEZI|nr:uncharacterized protein LAJ45_03465 [Morchella importuna]KAH8152624.1 hypothetical protein LAJ45_03465 [Morchella importuna]RPB11061.1 hypothetical protein P167DRAFT_566155 [Morchella conica CCBAS932]
MRSSLVRSPAVRQLTARRFASTGSETAAKATSEASAKAQEASKKAQDAVKVAAGKLGAAASGVGNSLMKVGGRTGKLIHTISAMIPPAQYYGRVGLELSKLVFHGQKMAPPKLETFRTTFSPVINTLKGLRTAPSATISNMSSQTASLNMSPRYLLERLQSISRAQVLAGGVLAAEVIGFFTIGEIIGRRKLIGYRGAEQHH